MGMHYEPGNYVARVTNQAFTMTKKGDKPMIVFNIQPTHSLRFANTDMEEIYPTNENYDRTIRLVIDPSNEKMMDFAMKKLRYAGFLGDRFEDLNLEGSDIRVYCEPNNYTKDDGTTVEIEAWDFMLPPREASLVENDPSIAKKLNAMFGKKLKEGSKKPEAKQEASAETVPPSDEDDDDVPF